MVHNSRIKRISLAVCLALMPFAVDAAGLGKMTVMSGLGEPLNAEIEISASKEELSTLSARIAPSEIYAEQGVERAASLGGVRVELARKPNGSPVLKLSSPQPVNEPFLDMLVLVDWPTGRLLREYTALLDPPGYGDRANAAYDAAVEGTQLPAVKTPSKKNTTKSASPLTREAPTVNGQPESGAPAEAYVTKRGDTLRSVARQMQVDDVTLEQMLVGLYRGNRSAFSGDNMNRLKVGQIIRAPGEKELQAVSPQESLQEVRVHAANWNAYRNNLAGAVAQSAPAESEPQQQSSSGKITAAAEDKAAPPAAGPRDVIKLSKSDVGADKAGAATGSKAPADDQLKALEEESTAQERTIAEVNERIAFFEKQIQDMQKLLLVQNQILAELQKAEQASAETGAVTAPAGEPQAQQPPPAAAAAPAAKPAPAPLPELSLQDRVMQDPVLLGGAAGGLILLLGGVWFLLRNQRRKNLDNFEQGILTSGGLKTDTVFGTTGGAAVDTGETSFLSDFSHRNGAGMIDTSDVDPISEAEVYMAYGRDAQAEEILKDAIVKDPKRYELHLKLLEIYANRKDAIAFETLAGELYATLGTNDPRWRKIAEIGYALEPENPMYAAVTGSTETAPTEDNSAAAAVLAGTAAAAAASSFDMPPNAEEAEADAAAVQENSLDFDLGMLAGDQSETAPDAEEAVSGMESLPELESFEAPAVEDEAIAPAAEDEASAMDFQFDLPEPAAEENVQLEAADLGLPETASEMPPAAAEPMPELPELNAGESTTETAFESAQQDEEEKAGFDLALPELTVSETPEEVVEEISFELPELAAPETSPAEEEEVFKLPEAVAETPAEAEQEEEAPPAAELPEIEEPKHPLMTEDAGTAVEIEEIVMDEKSSEDNKLDFNFDLDMEPEPAASAAPPETATNLPDLDLSGISLEIGEQGFSEAPEPEEITLSGAESSDVDTKLDLVTAYMDMGDTEGARELLEEVLQEGGPQQRERAQKLLDSLA